MNKRLLFLGILIITFTYSFFSIITYKDYGITSDEELEYKSGKVLLEYYKTGEIPNNINLAERHLPDKSMYFRGHLSISNILNPNFYYEQFHLINMFYALPIFIAIYIFLYKQYKNFYLAFLGPIFLFLTPRLFGHIPANPKDVPFAVIYFISLLGIFYSAKLPKFRLFNFIILGLLFGISQSFRSIGFTLHIILFLYSLLISRVDKETFIKSILRFFSILTISIIVMTLLLPSLQKDFLDGFREIFLNSKSFTYWDNKIVYFGRLLGKEDRPPSYLPVWLFISTPLFILVTFFLSPVIYYFKESPRKALLLFLLSILVNLISYFVLNPVIYNGLRHFLYLLPIIIIVSIISTIEMLRIVDQKSKLLLILSLIVIITSMTFVFREKCKLYPYEYIYFNEIIGGLPKASGRFDSEYWGASYKENAVWLRENIKSDKPIKVYACNVSFSVDYYSQKKFEMVGSKADADYIICDYDNTLKDNSSFEIMNVIERLGVPINYVGKL